MGFYKEEGVGVKSILKRNIATGCSCDWAKMSLVILLLSDLHVYTGRFIDKHRNLTLPYLFFIMEKS